MPKEGGIVPLLFKWILDKVEMILADIVGILFIMLTVSVATEVFARYVLGSSIGWSYEFARYIFIWLTFLGAGVGWRRNEHAVLTFLKEAFAPKVQKVVSLTVCILISFLAILLIWYGIELAFVISKQLSPALRIPMSIPYLSIPIGSICLLLFLLESILTELGLLKDENQGATVPMEKPMAR